MTRFFMTPYVFLWEAPDGARHWEAVKEEQVSGFLEKLLSDGVHPATVMVAYTPILFHWVWKKFHKGLSDVFFGRIDKDIYGTEPVAESKHEPVDVPEREQTTATKFGWLAPDGRFFGCNYGEHSALATRIVGKIQYVANPERHLEDLGWAKIYSGTESRKRYSIGMGIGKKLSDTQLKTLECMGLERAYGISGLL